MSYLTVRIKKVNPEIETVIPTYAKDGDAGKDLVATSVKYTNQYVEYGTNLAFEIPAGYVGLLFPRSSISKYDLRLCNSVGVLDSGYRGEVTFRFRITSDSPYSNFYKVGDKIGQIIVLPHPFVVFDPVDELSDSERGNGGYGSSGT